MSDKAAKTLKDVKLWVIILLVSAALWIFVFYWASLPSSQETFTLWIGADFTLKEEIKNEIKDVCKNYAIRDCNINSYSPSDTYYAAAFGIQSNTVDIYILEKTEAETEAQSGIFRVLEGEFLYENVLSINEQPYGILFYGDYYIFLNSRSDKSDALLKEVVDVLVARGGETT